MKKIFLCLVACCTMAIYANAQIMRAEELEIYAKEKYGEKWKNAAEYLAQYLVLDKNNSLTYTQVIECGEQTKTQLYVALNYWFTATFNDANAVIQLNDKETGTIIAKGFVGNITHHEGGANIYNVHISPIIRVDIKDYKIRVTYTIQNYDVDVIAGGGIWGSVLGAIPNKSREKWTLDKCYPFFEEDRTKKTSSKALVMTHAYSNVIMDKIEEAAKNGLIGNENEDW